MSRTFLSAEILLLLTAAIWGSSYSVVKSALAYYPVAGVIAIRFLLTVLLLVPHWLRLSSEQKRATVAAAVPTGLGLLAIFFAETAGVAQTSAGNAAFLVSLCLLLTPPVEWLWFGKRPAAKLWLAAIVSLLGTWLLTGLAGGSLGQGDALMLLAALLRAFHTCLTTRLTAGKQLDSVGLTAMQAVIVGAGSLLIGLSQPDGLPALPNDLHFWAAIGFLTVFCTLFAFWAMNRSLAATSPSKVALLLGSEPLWGAMFAVLWLGEDLGGHAWLGGLMVASAALWMAWPSGARAVGTTRQPA